MVEELEELRKNTKLYLSPKEIFRVTQKTIDSINGDLDLFERDSRFKDLRELFTVAVMAFAVLKDRKESNVWLRPGDDPPDVEWLDTS